MPGPIGREAGSGHRIVSAAMLPDQITECPHCGSKNFALIGEFERPFEHVFENGQPKEGGLTLVPQAIQSVEGIVCGSSTCGIHTIIEDNEVFERESLIFDLQTQIATLQGRVSVSGPAKEWKN